MILSSTKKPFFKTNLYLFIVFLLFSFIILATSSANSFLYSFNPWCDMNWYVTMGNGILDGKIVYKDLYDHKGPLLFFIFAFLCVFKNAYIAVYIFESLCLALSLFTLFKLFLKFTSPLFAMISCFLTGVFSVTVNFFGLGGGAVEEYLFPISIYFILFLFEFVDGKKHSKLTFFFIGIFLACLFWVKFTTIALAGIVLITYVVHEILHKNYKQLAQNVFVAILGFIALTIPVLLYFIFNDAVSNLFVHYFYDNLFRYSPGGLYLFHLNQNRFASILIFLSLILVAIKQKKKALWFECVALTYLIFLILTGKFIYYFYNLSIFVGISICIIADLFKKIKFSKLQTLCLLIITLCVSIDCSVKGGNFIDAINMKKEDHVQYQVAADIHTLKNEKPTMFCYLMQDEGYYNAAGIVPNEKYYGLNGFSPKEYPELYKAHDDVVINAEADFIVTKHSNYLKLKSDFDRNYKIVKYYYSEIILLQKI